MIENLSREQLAAILETLPMDITDIKKIEGEKRTLEY